MIIICISWILFIQLVGHGGKIEQLPKYKHEAYNSTGKGCIDYTIIHVQHLYEYQLNHSLIIIQIVK